MATNWDDFEPVDTGVKPVAVKGGKVDWSQFTPVKPDDSSDMGRGFKESFQQLPQLGYGLLAGAGAAAESAFGEGGIATGIKKAGVAGYQDWGNKIASKSKESDSWDYSYEQAKQGNLGALVDWLQHGIGYVGGQGVQMLMTAGIGSVAGKFVAGTAAKQIAEGMVAKSAAEIAATQAGAKLTAAELTEAATANVMGKFSSIGQNTAVGAMGFGQEGGEIFGDLSKRSEDEGRSLTGAELGKAFAASLAAGALEFVGDKIGLDVILGKSKLLKPAEGMTGIGGRVARGGIAAAAEAPIEAGTEYAQTGLENYGKGKEENIPPFNQSEAAQKDARESAMLGALGGAVIGGAGGAIHGAKRPDVVAPPAEAPAPPLQLGNTPDPFISFPDGTVGKRADVERYVASLPENQQNDARAALLGVNPQRSPIEKIAQAETVDDAIAAATEAVSQPLELPDVDESALSPFMRRGPGATLERTLGGITLDADMARQLAQREAELEAIGGTAPEARAEFDAQQEALKRAAAVEAPSAMELALRRAAPVVEASAAPAAPAEPRIVARTPDMQPTSLAKAQAQADAIGGEVARVQNQSGKFAYVALPSGQKEIQPGDFLTGDGKPYGSLIAAKVRARKEGADVVPVTGGWVVRPKQAAPVAIDAPTIAAAPAVTTEAAPDERIAVPAAPGPAIGDRDGIADDTGSVAADGRLDAVPEPSLPGGVAPAAGPAGDAGLAGRADDQAVAPPKAPILSVKSNKDGTVMVLGKPADIQAALPGVNGIPGKRGVMFGKRQAASVQKAVDAFNEHGGPEARVGGAMEAGGPKQKRDRNGYALVQLRGKQHAITPHSGGRFIIRGMDGVRVTMDDGRTPAIFDSEAQAISYTAERGGPAVAAPAPAKVKRRRTVDPTRDTLLQAVAKMGGLDRDELAREFGLKPEELKSTVAAGNLKAYPFRKSGGLSVDAAIEQLAEAGYFDGVATEDVRRALEEAIFAELGGSPRLATQGLMREAEERGAQDAAEQQAQAEAEEFGDAERQELDAIFATNEGLRDIRRLDDDDLPGLDMPGETDPAAIMRALGFTEQEIADDLAAQAAQQGGEDQAGARAGQDAAGQAPAPGGARSEAPEGDAALSLTAPTPEELQAKASAEAKAQAADKAEQKRLADKVKADAERGEFTLTGSDSAADVAAAAGQNDLFAAAPAAEAAAILDAAEITGKDRIDAIKDVKAGTITTDELRAAYPAASASSDEAKEPQTQYELAYDQDLFGNPVPNGTRGAALAGPDKPGVPRDVQPQPDLPGDTAAPVGDYYTRTFVGSEARREIGAERIDSAQQAAQATAYLYKSAVERFDGIVTDEDGKPLAVIGGFKGAISQASVYPSTLIAEAVRIPGAARIWFSHNHPGGKADLSSADIALNGTLTRVFRGSGIEPMGLLAIGGGEFSHVGPGGEQSGVSTLPRSTGRATVPVVEREIRASKPDVFLGEPSAAKRAAKQFYSMANEPGMILLNSQLGVVGWVPLDEKMMGRLRDTGGLNALYRAISESNAGMVILAHGGELDARGSLPGRASIASNVAGALNTAGARVLDVINAKTGVSEAEVGGDAPSSQTFAREDAPTEYGDPSPEESAQVEAGLNGKTLLQAADWLAENAPPELGLIAQAARKQLGRLQLAGAKFSFNIAHKGDMVPRLLLGSRGITDYHFGASAGKGKIDVWLNGADVTGKVGVSFETATHEIVHAATMAAVRLGNFKSQEGTPLAKHVSDLYAVTNHVRAVFNKRVAEFRAGNRILTDFEQRMYQRANNAFADANETITWALTDRDAQTFLESIEYKGKSAWTSFVQIIRSLLGLNPKADTALAEILRVSEELLADETHTLTEGMLSRDGKDTVMQRGMTDMTLPADSITQAHQSSEQVKRRDLLLAAAAMAAPSTSNAATNLGKARAVSAETLKQTMAPAIVKALRNGVAGGITEIKGAPAIIAAMQEIARTGPVELRALAAQIAGLLPTEKVMLTVDDRRVMNAHGAVTWDGGAPHLQLFTAAGRTGLSYGTFMHEALHLAVLARYKTLSSGVLRSNDAKLGVGAPKASASLAQFRALWDEFEAAAKANPPKDEDTKLSVDEAVSSPDEFFVRALTDAHLQAYMAGIAYEGRSMLERFKDWVTGLFIKSGTRPSWLDAALLASQELSRDMAGDRADYARLRASGALSSQREAVYSVVSQPSNRQRIADKLRNAGGGPKIIGNTGRAYTPAQLAAMRAVGFQVTAPTLEERAKAVWKDAGKKLAQGLVDQFAPIKELSTEAYSLLRLAKGASGAFEAMLQGGKLKLSDGVYDFDDTQRGGVVDTLLKPLSGEHHDFFRWVAANRAERLLGEGKENLFTPDDIKALKTLADGTASFDYELQHGPKAGTKTRDRSLIYADALKTFNSFNKNVLDLAEQSGLIDGESRKLWEHEFYVPFYRVAEEDGAVGGVNIKGGAVRQQAFKQLKGGKQALNADLMDNTLMNWAHLLDASAKNRAAVATLNAAENMGVAISAPESTAREMANSIGQKGNVVWVMDGGQKHFYIVEDPYVLTALTSLEYAGMRSPIMKALGSFKHALTLGVTASPFFKVRNLIRDSVQAIGASPLSYNVAQNLAQGWKLTAPKSDAYFRLLAGGGTIHFGTMLEGSESKRVQALVESGVDAGTILNSDQKMKAFYRKFIEPSITAYNELGNRGEAINRASLYDQLRKQGMSHAQASLQARDLMDFSMQGSFTSVRFLTQVVPFFNARLQGLYKLGRAAKEDPAKMSTVIGAAALASLGLLLAYGDDDDWRKREDWDRNNFWWFKFGGTAFRIPKPFEVGAIATLAERGFEYAFDKEMTSKNFRSNVLALLGDNLSMNPIPQLAKPLIDVYANKEGFTGRPIETMGMERLQAEYRFNSRTSMTARGISTALNSVAGAVGAQSLSPVQVDALLRGYFGWLGSFVVGAGDVIARPMTDQPTRPDSDLFKAATGGMASDLRDAPSRYVSHIYEQATKVEQAYNTWKALVKEGKTEEATEFLADNREEIGRYRMVENLKKRVGTINQQIKRIELSDESGQTKRERIRELLARKDRVARTLEGA